MDEPNRNRYASNSHTSKQEPETTPERPKMERVTTNKVKVRTPIGRRIAAAFTGDEATSVGEYLVFDVLIPAVKSMISDGVSQGVNMMLFGNPGSRATGSRGSYSYGSNNRTNYASRYPGRDFERGPAERPGISQRARANHQFDEIICSTRREADDVIEALKMAAEEYGTVSVGDLYEAVGEDSDYTDRDWGWKRGELRDARSRMVRPDAFLLDLPPASPIPK